ncbi:MAG: hypothetical protein KIT84_18545 [Labilithrix sp.]|nr:hypothetical protein [Labilithrix sp.]MCW5813034.1 hypothetical protein [Labilithrix sp.]
MSRRRRAAVRHVALTSLVLVACGSRTGLFGDEDGPGGIIIEADASVDVRVRFDASGFIDGEPPPIDARPPPVDVYRADCPDSDALLVYTITNDHRLQSFDPAAGTFRDVGRISCPASPGATPFSMAVDRKGTAYILFTDYKIYRASTSNGACIETPYVPRQSNFARFGMGFVTIAGGPEERLYVAGDDDNVGSGDPNGARGIASIDPETFKLTVIGDDPRFDSAELTGTGDGRLFAFYRHTDGFGDSYIGEVDQESGFIRAERHLPTVELGQGWAFAFWGGDFYMFHAPSSIGATLITRWRPADDTVETVASAPPGTIIVGAGVSTCAPQN